MKPWPSSFGVYGRSHYPSDAVVRALRMELGRADATALRRLSASRHADDFDHDLLPDWSHAESEARARGSFVEAETAHGTTFSISHLRDGVHIRVSFKSTLTRDAAARSLTEAASLFVSLARSGVIDSAKLLRGESSGGAPTPPLSDCDMHAVVIAPSEIAAVYGRPDVLSEHGWDTERLSDDRWLLNRALDALDDVDFELSTGEHQWALARLAPPGKTRIGPPDIRSDEMRALLSRGEPTLLRSYSSAERELVFSAVLPAGVDVRPWEIWQIQHVVTARETDSAEPVERVRVVFADRETAEREKRPLLDVGAVVQFLGPDGLVLVEP